MVTDPIVIKRGRVKVVRFELGYDVSGDVLTSEIRSDKNTASALIATWEVSFENDGTDGKVLLTLDDSVTADIVKSDGWTDIKRVADGQAVPVFDDPIPVVIEGVVTE